jgi:hypothetical protein
MDIIIDLGTASTETRGGDLGGFDSVVNPAHTMQEI